ncbi:hypothetical protein BU24DRAFT_494892 [Aaosphaeria arxii CBS 175.79]|uniref:Zn(2)-C6 fungal-type domain-containing protein n=1 Tax=Aaosphaeria arxii CBS 175.79 TaxID=1450172 RepID=A0A6A5XJG1_9PLEO|nr:uncharacterized protein BU24DRAFT_494892 [Aaosphaeria arxii CBS 175.79]KAF2012999.1 hypothetical protein BU24DRAFT_494892 [Aaosphaeria arxii CBS 175.79]
MPPQTKQQPKRKHVTTACISCRESKVKCDGVTPTCRNCANKGKECRYQAGEDKRKLSLRVAIELLSARVSQLSRHIESNGLQVPAMTPSDEKALKRVLDTLGLAQVETSHSQQEGESQNDTVTQQLTPASESQSANILPVQKDAAIIDENNTTRDIHTSPGLSNRSCDETERNVSTFPIQTTSVDGFPLQIDKGAAELSPNHQPMMNTTCLTGDAASTWPWNGQNPTNINMPLPFPDHVSETQPINDLPPVINDTGEQIPTAGVDEPTPDEEATESDVMEEELVERLSYRMGTLQVEPNGQIRYYGATSNFNLIEMPASDNLTIHRTVRNNGAESLSLLGLNKEVPPEIEAHMINLYFTWQDPSFHVVDRAMYEQAKMKWEDDKEDTPYYSEALRNSMCALGAAFETRYHPTFVTFPKSLADFFGDRAKALLEIELDCPNVATVQAMVVLSAHDIGCKRDARGWLYSGMAMRLAFDLALHVDVSHYVSSGAIGVAEAELRRTVFWGAFTVDNLWGYYLGRPFRINIEDVTVGKPGEGFAPRQPGQWIPYTSAKSLEIHSPIPDYVEELNKERVTLTEIMAPLGHVLYGSLKTTSKALQKLNAATVDNLLEWEAQLPSVLQVDLSDFTTPYLPHVLLLHMQYHQNLIHAHRPWMSKSYVQPSPPQGPGHSHARQVCVSSAVAIAKLLSLYESHWTLRRMNIQGVSITCSAALLLTFAGISRYQGHSTETTAMHLSVCFRALDEFGPSWESAKRAREYLVRLQREWKNRARLSHPLPTQQNPAAFRGLHQGSSFMAHGASSRKRTRHSSDTESRTSATSYQDASPGQQLPHQQTGYGAMNGSSVQGEMDVDLGLELDWMFLWDNQVPRGMGVEDGMYSMPMDRFMHPLDRRM